MKCKNTWNFRSVRHELQCAVSNNLYKKKLRPCRYLKINHRLLVWRQSSAVQYFHRTTESRRLLNRSFWHFEQSPYSPISIHNPDHGTLEEADCCVTLRSPWASWPARQPRNFTKASYPYRNMARKPKKAPAPSAELVGPWRKEMMWMID